MISEGFKLIGREMDITVKSVRKMYNRTFDVHNIDLNIDQWPIMAVLYDYKELSQIEIAEKILKYPQSLSATFKLLLNKGYIC